jgi:SAM-dependent methyltransferase
MEMVCDDCLQSLLFKNEKANSLKVIRLFATSNHCSMQNNTTEARFNILIRERLCPSVSDQDYLCLGDLRAALGHVASDAHMTILDLGCGTSPYRSLFPNSDYRRADLKSTPNIDYSLSDPETIPTNHFDLVLSTQVLEHVCDPEVYLSLALRSLKPGGKIVLTTHGMFEEHACPEDYYRWTALGLERLLEKSGFTQSRSWKITTQQRASAYLMLRFFGLLGLKRNTVIGFLAAVTNRLLRFSAPVLHRWLDRHANECRMVDSNMPGHELYIVLMIEACKPKNSSDSL